MRKMILVAAPANDRVGKKFTGALLYTKVAGGAYFCCDKKIDLLELCFTQRLQGERLALQSASPGLSEALRQAEWIRFTVNGAEDEGRLMDGLGPMLTGVQYCVTV